MNLQEDSGAALTSASLAFAELAAKVCKVSRLPRGTTPTVAYSASLLELGPIYLGHHHFTPISLMVQPTKATENLYIEKLTRHQVEACWVPHCYNCILQ